MSIPSEPIADMYCEPQFSRMRVMIPAVQRQNGILLIRPGQQNDVEFAGGQGCIPRNSINNNQQANCINLHGNANTNVKILNKIAANNNNDDDDKNDNPIVPIDLPSVKTNQNKEFSANNLQDANKESKNIDNNSQVDRRVSSKTGKRKNSTSSKTSGNEDCLANGNKRNIESWVGHVKPVPGIPRQAGSKREEVLKAARSLFSKRTRTLYHWLCPSTSKTKLKSTVAAAWDTLSTAEKDFYISQVLGRFGVPACSLMVNPQLGGLKTEEKTGTTSTSSTGTSSNMEETRRAVTNLLLNEKDVAWSPYSQRQNDDLPRKKRKLYQNFNSVTGETSNNKEARKQNPEEDETLILKEIRDASLEEDFADDPELSTEFEQFRNLIDVELDRFDFNDVLDGI